jgi:subtilisin family serine protease
MHRAIDDYPWRTGEWSAHLKPEGSKIKFRQHFHKLWAGLILILVVQAAGYETTWAFPYGETDRTRLIVQLAPLGSEVRKLALGNSGRVQFDETLAEYGVNEMKQVFPPLASHRLSALARSSHLEDFVLLRVPTGTDPDALMQRLEALPDVLSAEFDVVVHICGSEITPNDPYYLTYQYPLRNTGAQPPPDPGIAGADLEMEGAWAYTTGDSSVIVAIIDTGIDWDHPDLAGNLWINTDEEEGDVDLDHNGYPGDYKGWNFAGSNFLSDDDHSHGSHVAGIVGAATNNSIGIAGMNWRCRLMAVKVLASNGSGSAESVAEGIYYAANNGASVINLSLGSYQSSGVEAAAIDYAVAAGVTVCAAMGNDNSGAPHYPSAFPNVIAVGATDSHDLRARPFCFSDASGSNYGPAIDVCAPGDWVWSTVPLENGSYAYKCGTSMATPHVAGLASLVKALRPSSTPAQVQDILQKAAEDLVGRSTEDTPGFDVYHGWGRINARATLQALAVALPPILTVPGAQTTTELDTLRVVIHAIDSNFTTPVLSASSLANAVFTDSGSGTGTLVFVPGISQQGSYEVDFVASDGALADTGHVSITVNDACLCRKHGDVNGDGVFDVFDVITAIDGVFAGTEPPPTDTDCPPHIHRGDFNCDRVYDVFDIITLIDYVFAGGLGPCNPCQT